MLLSKTRIKSVALGVALVAFFQNSVFAVAREVNSLAQWGTFRVSQAHVNSGSSVVHIQDVHMNLEAQRNIAAAVSHLAKGDADLIALEGAFGPLDFKQFSTYPFPASVKDVAGNMLEKALIPGAVFAALTDKNLPAVVGVDDERLYRENVDAYKRASFWMTKNARRVEKLEAALVLKKRDAFNPELLVYDRLVRGYRSKNVAFVDYVSALRARLSDDEAAAFPQTSKVVRAIGLESIIDLKAIREATSFEAYVRYFSMVQEIDGARFYDELAALERHLYRKLAATDADRKLIAAARRLDLVGKLVRFEMSPSEWEEYSAGRSDVERALIERTQDFEAFYESAKARDNAMAANLLSAMAERKASKAVLVTGGFHSHGMGALLDKAGVARRVFVPRITRLDGLRGSEYLSAFDRNKSPLELLFPSPRISVSQIGWKDSLQVQAMAAVIAAETRAGRRATVFAWFWPLIARYAALFFELLQHRFFAAIALVLLLPTVALAGNQIGFGGEYSILKLSLGIGLFFSTALVCVGIALWLSLFSSPSETPLFPSRFVPGLYWEPSLKIDEREFNHADVVRQLAAPERIVERKSQSATDFSKSLLKKAEEMKVILQLIEPLRGFDGPGSALDLRDYGRLKPKTKRLADVPSTITMATNNLCQIRIERIPEEERHVQDDDRLVQVEYVSTKRNGRHKVFFDDGVEVVTKENRELNSGKKIGMTVNGYEDMVGYIFINLFGLGGGIRIIDETDVPGGMESSSITVKALVEAAALLSGTKLSKADIWWLTTCLENGVFGGVTGGQGPISADLGGIYQNFWFTNGDRTVFSTELIPQAEWEAIEEHMMLAQAGVEERRDLPKIKRPGALINKMWLALLKNRDPKALPLFDEMIPLASKYAHALKKKDFETVIGTVNRLVEIRDALLRRWMSLMLDARARKTWQSDSLWWRRVPTYAQDFAKNAMHLENTDYVPIHQLLAFGLSRKELLETSLYTLFPIRDFLTEAYKWGLGAMPAGAGGLGSMIGVFSKEGRDNLESFAHFADLPHVNNVEDMRERHHLTVKIFGPMQIRGFDKIGVTLPEGPKKRFYDQEKGDIINDLEMNTRKESVSRFSERGGRWLFLIPFYQRAAEALLLKGYIAAGIVVSKVILPVAIESGIFVIGGSYLTASLLGAPVGFSSSFGMLIVSFTMLWLFIDRTGGRSAKNDDSFLIAATTIIIYMAGFGFADRAFALPFTLAAALLPHLFVNTARALQEISFHPVSLFQTPADPVKIPRAAFAGPASLWSDAPFSERRKPNEEA